MIYWDTSAIVPLYVDEASSSDWESLLVQSGTPAKSSTLCITEFHCALRHKKYRRNLSEASVEALIQKFTADCKHGRWELYPLGADIIQASLQVARKSHTAPNPVPLRSLDSLHLATALTLRCDTFATGDRRLAAAAEKLGFDLVLKE